MDSNVGPYDQLIRIIIGVAAGWEVFLMPAQGWWLILLSLSSLMSGVLGICPIYRLIGGSTNGAKSDPDSSNRQSSPP
jgi:hypothetical protein